MNVRLLYGIQSAALREQCLREVIAFSDQWPDRRAIILVPEQAKLDYEQAYLELSRTSSLLMAEVLSFRRLSARLSGEAGQLTGPTLTKTGQAMLLYRLMVESRSELHSYARLADKPGFIRQISAVLGDLRRYQVEAVTLSSLLDQIKDKALQNKINDLALLLDRYGAAVSDLDLADPETELDRLAHLLEHPSELAASRLAWLSQTSVWVAGFGELRNFTPQEYAVLDQLQKRCPHMTISVLCDFIPADEAAVELGPDLFLPGRRTAYQLHTRYQPAKSIRVEPTWSPKVASLAGFLGAPAEWTVSTSSAESSASTRSAKAETSDYLETILTASPDDQAIWLASEIRKRVSQGTCRYRDLVIAVCDPGQDLPRLQAAFNQFEIPLFLDQVRTLAGSALMRTVLSVLDIVGSGFGRLPVMRALRAGLLQTDPRQVDLFENHVLAHGLFHLDRLLTQEADEPDILTEIRNQVFLPIRDFALQMHKAKTGQERVAALVFYLETSDLQALTSQVIARLQQEQDSESALALAKSWNVLADVLHQLVHFAGSAPMSLKAFRDLLAAGLENADSGVLPSALDQVAIGNLAHARQRHGKVLYIYNARAGTFPPGAPPEGLLKDSDRQNLSSLLGQTLPSNARDQVFADAAMIFGLLTLPTERLVLLAPAQDPTPTIHRLEEWSGKQSILLASLPAAAVFLKTPGPQSKGADPLHVQIDSSLIEARFGTILQMSVSQLEKYARCPFQHLAAHGILLRERDIFEPQAAQSGTLLHELAEKSLLQLQSDWHLLGDETERNERIQAWLSSELDNILTGVMTQLQMDDHLGQFFRPGLRASVGRRLERVARTSIAALLRQLLKESYSPALFEWVFEPGQGNALTIALDQTHSVQLNGKVDRVDLCQEEQTNLFRIIDYKSGSQGVNYDELYHGLQMQLPAYLAAFRSCHDGQVAADACYFHFDQPIIRQDLSDQTDPEETIRQLDKRFALESLALPVDQLERIQAHVKERIRRWSQGIIRGEFSARPRQVKNQKLPCSYCAFRAVCGFDPNRDNSDRLAPLGRPKSGDEPKLSRKDDFQERLRQAYPLPDGDEACN